MKNLITLTESLTKWMTAPIEVPRGLLIVWQVTFILYGLWFIAAR
jgi:hypothetical protein